MGELSTRFNNFSEKLKGKRMETILEVGGCYIVETKPMSEQCSEPRPGQHYYKDDASPVNKIWKRAKTVGDS